MIRKTVTAVFVLLLTTLTVGCASKVAGVKVQIPGVEVGLQGGGNIHCPPGQAKKGNC